MSMTGRRVDRLVEKRQICHVAGKAAQSAADFLHLLDERLVSNTRAGGPRDDHDVLSAIRCHPGDDRAAQAT